MAVLDLIRLRQVRWDTTFQASVGVKCLVTDVSQMPWVMRHVAESFVRSGFPE